MRLKQLSIQIYQPDTIKSKALANIIMHENDSVFCELSTDSCHHKATVSLVLSVCMKQSDRQFYS